MPMEIPVIYEDEQIVVIDKPSGVVVNRAETVRGETLQDWWESRYGQMRSNDIIRDQMISNEQLPPSKYRGTSDVLTDEDRRYFAERMGMVHRLDKETSGVMVFAKTSEAFVEMLRQFRDREIKKEYLALTHGIWKVKKGEINMPIGRRHDDRKKMGIQEDGRESVTGYQVISEYPKFAFPKELKVDIKGYQGFSLVKFAPRTGRTHQIRVHARALAHPLVGDIQYAGRKRSREDRKWCNRLALQAQTLSILHPVTKERMNFESQQSLGDWDRYFTVERSRMREAR